MLADICQIRIEHKKRKRQWKIKKNEKYEGGSASYTLQANKVGVLCICSLALVVLSCSK